ncbi:MAG: SOUL family heme-binding protein [Bacteroidota bacterium]
MKKYYDVLNYWKVLFLMFTVINIGMAIEEPKYTVVKSDGKIEIREYQSYIVAEVFVPGSEMNEASNAGFRKLFKYISGNNRSSADIAMTAPVTTTRSEKIEMTAPVTAQQTDDGFAIAFVLPEEFTLATAPVPSDSTIHLREVPARRAAVIKFSGRWTEENMREHQQMLYNWLKEHSIEAVAPPVIARYDPPFMPWFLRRNEIQIDIPVF